MSDRLFYVLLPRFNMFSLTNLMEPARIANYLSVEDVYHKKYLSFDGPDITASNGMAVKCEMAPGQIRRNDLIFIVGSWGAEHYANGKLFSWLRLQARNGVRICAVEMGAYVLARAGLLARRSATTHWSYLAGFQEQFPDVDVQEQLFTEDGPILCCSGATAGLDLMLYIIGGRHGQALAGEISDQIIHHPCLLYTSPSPRDRTRSRMPSSA